MPNDTHSLSRTLTGRVTRGWSLSKLFPFVHTHLSCELAHWPWGWLTFYLLSSDAKDGSMESFGRKGFICWEALESLELDIYTRMLNVLYMSQNTLQISSVGWKTRKKAQRKTNRGTSIINVASLMGRSMNREKIHAKRVLSVAWSKGYQRCCFLRQEQPAKLL